MAASSEDVPPCGHTRKPKALALRWHPPVLMAEHHVVCVAAPCAKRVKLALEEQGWLLKNLVGVGVSPDEAAGACRDILAAIDGLGASTKAVYFPLSNSADRDTLSAWDGVLGVSAGRIPVKVKAKQALPAAKHVDTSPLGKAAPSQAPGDSFHGGNAIGCMDLSMNAWQAQGGSGGVGQWRLWLSARLASVFRGHVPVLLRGVPVGSCVQTWTERRLAVDVRKKVAAQVCPHQKIDLAGHRAKNTRGNFAFCDMSFSELIARCAQGTEHRVPQEDVHTLSELQEPSDDALQVDTTAVTADEALPCITEPGERYYLRSVPDGKMKTGSHFPDLFPSIAGDFDLAGLNTLVAGASSMVYHSSAMRVTSPMTELWTHYDIMDNLLVQVLGAKKCSLWSPACEPDLYVEGTSSRVDSIDDPTWSKFPRFRAARDRRVEVDLRAGEILYIPALWLHHTLSTSDRMSVAVNVFYESTRLRTHYHPKDVYANKDLPLGVKAVESALRTADLLAALPQPFQSFYAMRAAEALMHRCHVNRIAPYAGMRPVAVVTGATGQIGGAVCSALVERGFYVVAITRRREVDVAWELGVDGCVRVCDLACGRSIASCVDDLRHEFGHCGVAHLVNAAAVVPSHRILTDDGIELQFAVNVLSYHRFIRELEPMHLQTVTNVASAWADGLRMSLADINFEGEKYSSAKAYRAAKQANRVMSRAYQARFDADGMTDASPVVTACHPGAVAGSNVSTALGLKAQQATHTAEEAAVAVLKVIDTPAVDRGDFKGKFVKAVSPGEVTVTDDAQWDAHGTALMAILDELA